ncbi:MAG: caspase family protein [Myxococcota bacterium]
MALFHYSGHGQQIPDDDADEVDGYDESLVPYDNRGTKDGSNHLRDDELGQLVKELGAHTDNIVVTLDSCHSGTGTRGAYPMRGGPPSGPPADARGAEDDGPSGLGGARTAGYVLLSATRPDQLAGETRDPASGKVMGAFSYELVRALRAATPDTTYRQLMDRIAVRMLATTKTQNPQIEGDARKRLFSGAWTTPAEYVLARPMSADGKITLEAGTLFGLTVGSELGLWPVAGGDLDLEHPLARVRVESVELTNSVARLTEASANVPAATFADGARAVELYGMQTPDRLRVSAAKAPASLREALAGLAFVTLVTPAVGARGGGRDGDPGWDVSLEKDGDDVRAQAADGSPVLFPRGAEQPMDKTVSAKDPGLAARAVAALEAHYRRARLARLVNDDTRTRLGVTLEVHKVDAAIEGGVPVVRGDRGTLPKDGSGNLRDGDTVQFHVRNDSDKTAYVTVVELATDGEIVVWYPDDLMAPADAALAPGEERVIPSVLQITPPGGALVYKVIATESEVDLRGLTHRVKAGGRGEEHPLEAMMDDIAAPSRAKPLGFAKKERWGTDEARLEVAE